MPVPRLRLVVTLAALLLLVALGSWRLLRPSRAPELSAPTLASPSPPTPTANDPLGSPLANELHAPRHDAAHDLVVLRGLLSQFTTTLRLAERPPLGDNADITAALTGANRRRLVVIPPQHPALRSGLLVDRHGTPYHFHARSADSIDVRSAGSDLTLFTADDLVEAPLTTPQPQSPAPP